MTISFSGLGSGLDTSSWVEALVSVKQQKVTEMQTTLKSIQTQKNTLTTTRSTFSNFRSSLEKITDKKFGGTFDLFAKSTAKSSNEDIFTAVATTGAVRQNYNLSVQQLATCTKATSKNSVSQVADDTTSLKNLGLKEGSFAVYVDGVKTTINIENGFTLGDLKTQLSSAGVDTNIDEKGVLKLSAHNPDEEFHIGSTTDTSNFASLLGLEVKEDGSYVSTNSLFKVNLSTKLTAEDAGFNQQITAGTFTIGNALFSIGAGTTLSSLISQINESDEAQASAYWDDTTGKLTITSKTEGASYINIEAGTSNFTDVMGFTETVRDEDNNITSSKMYIDVQELGKNALFTINGTGMVSTSNTVSSDISRIEGVTITLNKVSTEEDGETTLSVSQDTSGLVDAVKAFIDSYNEVITKVDEVTASGADLQRESTLRSFKDTIRNYAMSANTTNGGEYIALSQIGITASKADGSNVSSDSGKLEFDEEAFLSALEENPESVEALLADENGILNQMESAVEVSLKAATGFFDVKQNTLDSEIKKTEEKITKQKEKISTYKTQLEKKFQIMEEMMTKMQQNYSSLLSSS